MYSINLTVREAIQRLAQYNIKLERFGSLQWRLSYREDNSHEHSRLVDSLEDGLMVASDMRFARTQEPLVRAMPVRMTRRAIRSQFVARQLARLEAIQC